MSSTGRRSRGNLASVREPSSNHRVRKRPSMEDTDEADVSFGSNVSIIFRGEDMDNEHLTQHLGKHQKVDANSSASATRENVRVSAPRSARHSTRRSLAGSASGRRQSARLSQHFKELSLKNNMAEINQRNGIFGDATVNNASNLVIHDSFDPTHTNQTLQVRVPLEQPLQQQQLQPVSNQQQLLLLERLQQSQQLNEMPSMESQHQHSVSSQPLHDVTSSLLNTATSRYVQQQVLNAVTCRSVQQQTCTTTCRSVQPQMLNTATCSSIQQQVNDKGTCSSVQQVLHPGTCSPVPQQVLGSTVVSSCVAATSQSLHDSEAFSTASHTVNRTCPTQTQCIPQQVQSQAELQSEHEQQQGSSSTSSDNSAQSESQSNISSQYLQDCNSVTSCEAEKSVTSESSMDSTRSPHLVLHCSSRAMPMPHLTWADREQVWLHMCLKDEQYKRSPTVLDRHPAMHPRMRAILLDWICEVCEVYKLHRETYYLSVDFIDRYLLATRNVPKQQLQLLGITCLFIAAKVEEIYPPKLSEFSYVTDGACRDEEIMEKELVVIQVLSWQLSPLTVNTWLNTYLQLLQEITRADPPAAAGRETEFVYQRFSGNTFVQICRLLDLCVLEVSSLQFSPSLLAAAALSYFFGSVVAGRVSGFALTDLVPAQRWMKAFAMVIQQLKEPAPLKPFRSVAPDDRHNIQTKTVELSSLDEVLKNLEELQVQQELEQHRKALHQLPSSSSSYTRSSPPVPSSVLTPPKTDEKRECEGEALEGAVVESCEQGGVRPVYQGDADPPEVMEVR